MMIPTRPGCPRANCLLFTRWPSYAQYSGVRTSNLYVVNANGSGLHRITAERNGADRPLIDPLTGKIVYARWWRNHRFALDGMSTVADPNGGYRQHIGLSADRNNQVGGPDNLWRNTWHAATINPDGTGLAQWGGVHHKSDATHVYGGAFTPEGDLVANSPCPTCLKPAVLAVCAAITEARHLYADLGHYLPYPGLRHRL